MRTLVNLTVLNKTTSLKNLHTFGIEVSAQEVIELQSQEQALNFFKNEGKQFQHALILGGGSNVLFTENLQVPLIRNSIKGIGIIDESEEEVIVGFGGGENWHECVKYAIAHQWGGIENLSLIPGTMGAAPMQNIGAYGVELEQVFEYLEAIDRMSGDLVRFYHADCQFGYRWSIFKGNLKDKYFISQVALRLKKAPHQLNTSYGDIRTILNKTEQEATIESVSEAVIEIRQSKLPDPREIGNAGSFFKNPYIPQSHFTDLKKEFTKIPGYPLEGSDQVKVPAGWLIDHLGWKGYRKGDAGVHQKQALVLVNYGDATGKEILDLAIEIQQSVKEAFNIHIEPEVNIYHG
ncbi:MAG: UDP-N-acetylmuramate dehydrogenase [Cyclobacteriaceae bacterium]|nr:UDP-N-acetylmuramate dehydrogenase [Cyclobacteriaceae bacterium]MCH8514848.1 UDP-N-acetylmuramate dehydrogenase [Cyclobacteriaceae bacterium]